MAVYATISEVAAGFRELDADEESRAAQLLLEAGVLIDAMAAKASDDAKRVVSCRMVRRALAAGDDTSMVSAPMGSTQGSFAAGGYTQSWTVGSGGAVGELYLGRSDRLLLGIGNRIGARSPLECASGGRIATPVCALVRNDKELFEGGGCGD